MDPDNFKDFANEMAEYITNYIETIRDRYVKSYDAIIRKNYCYN